MAAVSGTGMAIMRVMQVVQSGVNIYLLCNKESSLTTWEKVQLAAEVAFTVVAIGGGTTYLVASRKVVDLTRMGLSVEVLREGVCNSMLALNLVRVSVVSLKLWLEEDRLMYGLLIVASGSLSEIGLLFDDPKSQAVASIIQAGAMLYQSGSMADAWRRISRWLGREDGVSKEIIQNVRKMASFMLIPEKYRARFFECIPDDELGRFPFKKNICPLTGKAIRFVAKLDDTDTIYERSALQKAIAEGKFPGRQIEIDPDSSPILKKFQDLIDFAIQWRIEEYTEDYKKINNTLLEACV